jgi:hypothetical protein
MIIFATMNRILSTLSVLVFSLILSPEGMASEQAGLECRYRDGWYILHEIRISCLESGCAYEIGTKQSTVEQGKLTLVDKTYTQERLNGMKLQLDSGPSIIVEKNWAGRFEGILSFGNGSFAYNEKTLCRLVSNR